MSTELLTAEQIAQRLKLKTNTVLKMAGEGRIPSVRISSRAVRFDWEKVWAALEQRGKKKAGQGS